MNIREVEEGGADKLKSVKGREVDGEKWSNKHQGGGGGGGCYVRRWRKRKRREETRWLGGSKGKMEVITDAVCWGETGLGGCWGG